MRLLRLTLASVFVAFLLLAQQPLNVVTGPPDPLLLRTVVTLTNMQVTSMFSAPTLVIPAPPAGSLIQVVGYTLENINGGTAYTAGGNIGLFYGNASPPVNQAASQISSAVLTTPTVTTISRVGSGTIASPGTASSLTVGAAVYIGNITQNFAQVGNAGTMRVEVQYVVTSGW